MRRAILADGQDCHRTHWLLAAISRAARIEQEQPVGILDKRDVRMTEDDHTRLWKLGAGSCSVGLALAQIMEHANHTATDLDLALRWERRQHLIRLDIAVDGVDRSERHKRVEGDKRREIARVQDEIHTLEGA